MNYYAGPDQPNYAKRTPPGGLVSTEGLNPAQKQAVTHQGTPINVMAGAVS